MKINKYYKIKSSNNQFQYTSFHFTNIIKKRNEHLKKMTNPFNINPASIL